ncbi:MAG: hypothetical protein E7H57_18095, partial [Pantoea sp.]|nr:hypothetical protein [Pantoea sp.]
NNRIAIKTTLDKQAFNSKNRIEFFINDFYEGEIHDGKSYLSYNTFNEDGTVTVKTNFTETPNVGDEVKVVLTNVDSTLYPNIDANTLIYRTTITADMLK